ncbi:SRPBCC family protein [Agitococcus lubricus]|uniref:Polyketide cyclase/dehydrase/lipid transport protein n=1 Tax=Agitococcus lubricus TaxID=1077255 RepID=A0A2T5J380_9GAMM|nr:SRPBCC family protein [Agitococcus lubricus]PTQ91042.1 hypothetical protein C8N29_101114 [Agitococcus lubricus]
MTAIAVKHVFQGSLDEVFEAVINADKYPFISRLAHVERLCCAHNGQKDGIGTQREVELGVLWFKEEFTAFERPYRVDYQIFEARPHFDHIQGGFAFKKVGHKRVEVTWSSTFYVPINALPPQIVSKVSEWMVKAAFKSALMVLDKKLRQQRKTLK